MRSQVGAELDPLGSAAGPAFTTPPPIDKGAALEEFRTYPGYSDVASSECVVDGIDMPCSMVTSENSAPCPPEGCGAQPQRYRNDKGEVRTYYTTPFMAFVNGISGHIGRMWIEDGMVPQDAGDFYFFLATTGRRNELPDGVQYANNFLPQQTRQPDWLRNFYREYQGTLARCIWKTFKETYYGAPSSASPISGANRLSPQTLRNAPAIDTSRTQKELGYPNDVKAFGATYPSDYKRGVNGTVYIASDIPETWTVRGRTFSKTVILYRTYVHELGNLLSYKLSRGESGEDYGDILGIISPINRSNQGDKDTGAKLEKCVFND